MSRRRVFALILSLPIGGLSLVAACDGDGDGMSPSTIGSIEVSVSTTGADLDPDGYSVLVDRGAGRSLGINASTTFGEMWVGDHEVELTGLAPNCVVVGPNTRTVTVVVGEIAATHFDVGCALVFRGRIAFERRLQGDREIFVVTGRDSGPSDPVSLTYDPNSDLSAWSPDGTRIAFRTSREGNHEIYVVDADGTNAVNLTNAPNSFEAEPAWSPDGTRIAFRTDRDGNSEIYVMKADGTNPVNLTNTPGLLAREPAWSPDGTRIAFRTGDLVGGDIYAMNADGSEPVNLTNAPGDDFDPAWSPDGTKIAFATDRDGNYEIYLMSADGSDPVNLTNASGDDFDPAWSPDGTKIAFSRHYERYVEVYVMNADGSDPVNLISIPDSDARDPDWAAE